MTRSKEKIENYLEAGVIRWFEGIVGFGGSFQQGLGIFRKLGPSHIR